MTTFGWIFFSLVGIAVLFFAVQLTRDIIWNRKLNQFHKVQKIITPKIPGIYWLKRSYGFVISTLLLATTVASGAFLAPQMLGDRILMNATPVKDQATLLKLIDESNSGYWWNNLFPEFGAVDDMANAPDQNQTDQATRDYIGTNNQVDGVDEADIVKTDGNTIYYATRYYNHVRVIDVNLDGTVDPQADIDLGNMYTDALYLTDTQLIVIGYVYTYVPYAYQDGVDFYGWAYTSYTGAVYVYNRSTMELEYKLETNSNFYQHRLIGNALYLVSSKYLNENDLRPEYKETINGQTSTSYLGYDSIYYFDDVPVYSMTVVTGIKLDTFDVTSQAFLGNVSEIYASTDAIYTVDNYTSWSSETYENRVQIIKYALDPETASVSYVGQKSLPGYVGDQYWMDEYDGVFRVVTSSWNPIHNALYVLGEDDQTDELQILGTIQEGLGQPNESIKSVRFNGGEGYVVTFETHDPLYTIDLSNPYEPVITGALEEPGFSTYLHVWDDQNHLIGFGFTADENGFVTGMKISAYDSQTVLDEYQLLNQNGQDNYSYSYSEASYNPKALMISPEKGIIAFPVMSWIYDASNPDNWTYTYRSEYLVFYIDFSAANPEDIISDPIVITQDPTNYYVGIDRGVYIDGIIYTLSYTELVSYNLQTRSVLEKIAFETYFDQNSDKVYGND